MKGKMLTKEKILNVFFENNALLEGHFLLSSGLHSPNYLQCALVLQHPEHAKMLCSELARLLKDRKIDLVAAPALGGIIVAHEVAKALKCRAIFAERVEGKLTLRRGFSIKSGEQVLVVEDVITTGGSTRETIDVVKRNGGIVIGVGCLVDRSDGNADVGVPYKSLLSFPIPTYTPETCPQCKNGGIPVKPGSRGL